MNCMINGYVVVRCRGSSTYMGVDRDAFTALGQAYFDKPRRLPHAAVEAYVRTLDQPGRYTPVCTNRPDAEILLRHSMLLEGAHELLGIRSSYLEDVCGWPVLREHGDFLGYDVVAVGEWSMLTRLLEPEVGGRANDILALLNSNGLLDDPAAMDLVNQRYRALTVQDVVEEVGGNSPAAPLECVQVFLIAASALPASGEVP